MALRNAREKKISELIKSGKYEFSKHAEREREADRISIIELEEALINCEIIEDYPNDPRGPSFLTLGFSKDRPIHAVCSLRTGPDELLLITIYDPSRNPLVWTENYRKRKE
jgi:hypothetical protein